MFVIGAETGFREGVVFILSIKGTEAVSERLKARTR